MIFWRSRLLVPQPRDDSLSGEPRDLRTLSPTSLLRYTTSHLITHTHRGALVSRQSDGLMADTGRSFHLVAERMAP
jgi:hypothetical protein